ncbi:hypothetical protein BKA62DRAFT_7022 [Auriculariales sp. MPI-PUGE-AT-0066]|nr:hypothetical protein BKA62DRAFT_7022 [Auriculariales sp. MPI-PUGE-AT-0066]
MASAALSLSISVSSMLYGVGLAMFILSLRVLRMNRQPANLLLLMPISTLFLCATTHVILGFAVAGNPIVTYPTPLTTLPPTTPTFAPLDAPLWFQSCQIGLYSTANLLADGLLIWRLNIIFERRLAYIIGPLVLLFASTFSGYAVTFLLQHERGIFTPSLRSWYTSFISVTLFANTCVRAMMVLHLFRIRFSGPDFRHIVLVMIESGASAAFPLLTLLVLHLKRTEYHFLMLSAMTPLTLIIATVNIVQTEHRRLVGSLKTTNSVVTCWCDSSFPKSQQRRRRARRGSSETLVPAAAREATTAGATTTACHPRSAHATPHRTEPSRSPAPAPVPSPAAGLTSALVPPPSPLRHTLRSSASLDDLSATLRRAELRRPPSALTQSVPCTCSSSRDRLAALA